MTRAANTTIVRLRASRWALALLLLAAAPVGAADYNAAGVIAFTRIQGKTYVLLADHHDSRRGWGTFGGHREHGESVEAAAAREFREETRCVYDYAPGALAVLPKVGRENFVTYILEVPYVPIQVFGSRPAARDCRGRPFQERGPWAWIPLDEVVAVLDAGAPKGVFALPRAFVPERAKRKLWDKSAAVLQLAIDQGYLR